MKSRKLSSTGDYTFGLNESNFITEVDAITQNIKTKLLLFREEWWEDLGDGIPLFQDVLGAYNLQSSQMALERLCDSRIIEVDGVLSVKSVNAIIDDINRSVYIEFEVDTIYGIISGEVEQ